MKKIIVPALILTLALGFFVGRLTAPALESAPAPTTAPPTEAVPAYPIDALFAKNPYDAQTYRALWEYELREVYASYQRFIPEEDYTPEGHEALSRSLYAYLDYAALRAEADAERPAGPDYETALGRLYRAGAEAIHEALEEAGYTTFYKSFVRLPDIEMMDGWEAEWAYWDHQNRFAYAPFPLARDWPELGLRLWSLRDAHGSVLEVEGNQVVLPLGVPYIWRNEPQALRADLDGDGLEEIAVTALQGHGTGYVGYGLCIVRPTPDAWPYFGTPYLYSNAEMAAFLAPELTLTVEDGDIVATAFGQTVRHPPYEGEDPFTWAKPVLEDVVSIVITEAGTLRLYLGVGVNTNLTPVSPIFIANLRAELGWDGENLYLINPTLTAD